MANIAEHTQISVSKVISPDMLTNAGLKNLWSAWNFIRQERDVPRMPGDILCHIKPLISLLLLTEVVGDGADYRVRVVGNRVLTDLRDIEVGQLVRHHQNPYVRSRFSVLLSVTYDGAAPVRGVFMSRTETGQLDYEVESLWLPFGSNGRIEKILSMCVFEPVRAVGTSQSTT